MNTEEKSGSEKPGLSAALIVIGLVLAALANTLNIASWAQLVLGVTAASLLFWVLIRASRRQS